MTLVSIVAARLMDKGSTRNRQQRRKQAKEMLRAVKTAKATRKPE